MNSPPVATSPTSTSSFPWKPDRLCSLRASSARIPDACGTFSDVAVLATFIVYVVLDARGEAAAFWACHLTHAIGTSTTLPTNCARGSSTASESEGPVVATLQAYRQPCRCTESVGSRYAWSPGPLPLPISLSLAISLSHISHFSHLTHLSVSSMSPLPALLFSCFSLST